MDADPVDWLVQRGFLTEERARLLRGDLAEAPTRLREVPDEKPARIGRYAILREIGRGGMAIVYEGRDDVLDRPVAVKVPRRQLRSSEVSRLRKEARALGRLDHPRIVRVHDAGVDQGRPFLVLQYVAGKTFLERIPDLSCRRKLEVLQAAAEGVAHAHGCGVLHRDLKPSNVLMPDEGLPVVGDFGLATLLNPEPGWTSAGGVLGTPGYMSPEQVDPSRGRVSERTDVWGLGAMMYHALSGLPPFSGTTITELITHILLAPPVPLRLLDRTLDPDVEAVCSKALSKDPADRYASAREFADDLRRCLRGERAIARRRGFWSRLVGWIDR